MHTVITGDYEPAAVQICDVSGSRVCRSMARQMARMSQEQQKQNQSCITKLVVRLSCIAEGLLAEADAVATLLASVINVLVTVAAGGTRNPYTRNKLSSASSAA